MAGTVSKHVYSAVILGSPNIDLDVSGGRLTLDSMRAPHVQGELEISIPSLTVLAALNPLAGKRIKVTATFTSPSAASVTRTFDLGLRNREMRTAQGIVSLSLASDEAILQDYAPRVDDRSRQSATSLRSVVNYVLGKAIPGASLAASPSTDSTVTAYWRVTNLIHNSSFEYDTFGWANDSLASGFDRTSVSAFIGTKAGHYQTTGPGRTAVKYDDIAVRAGQPYTASVRHRQVANAANRPAGILVRWFDARGTFLRDDYSPTVTSTGSSWTRVSMVGIMPPDAATRAAVLPYFDADAAGRYPAIDAAMFYEGDILIPEFDGETDDDANYSYVYSDELQTRGTSTRVPVIQRDPDSLLWEAGQSAMDFLAPLVKAAGLRLVCDEARVWTLRSDTYAASGTLALAHGTDIVESSHITSRDSGWCDAAVVKYLWTERSGVERTAFDSYAVSSSYTKLLFFEVRDTVYPGPGRAENIVKRAQKRGRELTARRVAVWSTRAEQAATATLDRAPAFAGSIESVSFDLSKDQMTIKATSE